MSDHQQDSTTLPSSTSTSATGMFSPDPSSPLGVIGSGANRATTTERRTTTTTTTKRTVRSSDDFYPGSTEIQQVRSESRSGSISNSEPLFNQDKQQQSHQSSSSSHHYTTSTNAPATATATPASSDRWTAESLQTPVVEDTEDGGKVLKLRFDVSQYNLDEIVVKTVENRLQIHAKHEEKSENKTVYREYNREFHLPDGTNVEQIRSTLSKDGFLTVECPLPKSQPLAASRRIPIEKF